MAVLLKGLFKHVCVVVHFLHKQFQNSREKLSLCVQVRDLIGTGAVFLPLMAPDELVSREI